MHGQPNARPGTKMIGTMLHRATAGMAHKDFEGKEAARAAAGAGQMPYMTANAPYGNGGAAAVIKYQPILYQFGSFLLSYQV